LPRVIFSGASVVLQNEFNEFPRSKKGIHFCERGWVEGLDMVETMDVAQRTNSYFSSERGI